MANHFKDYRAKINNAKEPVSDDELVKYLRTANNEGVSHDHADWKTTEIDMATTAEINPEDEDKERTILRNIEREQKAKNVAESLSDK